MKLIFVILLLTSVVETASSLRCYQCTSGKSWDNCKSKTTKAICGNETIGKCMWMTLNLTQGDQFTMKYARGCAKMCDAKQHPMCRKKGITCSVNCCEKDFCNLYPSKPRHASSLRCYQCTNATSWDNCKSKTTKAICGNETIGKCMWMTLNLTQGDQFTMKYARGCAKMCDAKQHPMCRNKGTTCSVNCCEKDFCNLYPSNSANQEHFLKYSSYIICMFIDFYILNFFK